MRQGSIPTIDLTGIAEVPRFFGLGKRLQEVGVTPVAVEPLSIAIEMVISGQNTVEELQASPAFKSRSKEDQAKVLLIIGQELEAPGSTNIVDPATLNQIQRFDNK